MAYPTTLDSFTPKVDDTNDVMAADVNGLQTAIAALQTKVGVDNSAVETSIDYKLGSVTGSNKAETQGNKRTSFQATPTDTAYPSEKLVKDSLNLKAPLASPTFTGTVILPKTLEIQDTSADHQYVLAVNELTADRTVTLPLLTGTDTFVFQAHTQTLTNKRVTQRVATTTDDATAIIDIDNCDVYELSAIANATEFTTTGTPTDGQKLIIRLKDAGASKSLTWTGFTAIGVTLPTATTAGKWHYIGATYNAAATAWHVIAVSTQA